MTGTSTPRLAVVAAGIATYAMLACGGGPAYDEYMTALRMSKSGQHSLEAQLAQTNRALALEPSSPEILEHRANLLAALGMTVDARADYDRVVELADRPYLRFERAAVRCAQNDVVGALTDLDTAILAQPDNVQFYPERAFARLAMGQDADARADLEHAMTHTNGGADRYATLRAAFLLVDGKPGEAIPLLDRAIEALDSRQAALPRAMRLLAHVALGDREKARADATAPDLPAADDADGAASWLTPRNCANAFIATRLGPLATAARDLLSPSAPSNSTRPTR